jgi:RNA polymerase sigma-70 factor (ECF subfamily)
VAQEAFVLAFLKLATFRGQSQFYTWLFRIARNLSVSRFRRARKTASLDAVESGGSQLLLSDEPAPDRQLLVEEAGTRVREALARLSEEHRAILILRELDELDYDAIAAALELPVGTVRSRLHRARLQLKAELEALETVTGSGTREKRTS